MGLAVRIIPTLLCRGRRLIKGAQFNAWRAVGVVTQAVRVHQARNVDELVLLDIGATPEGRGPDLALIQELTANCFMPLSIGGGVRTIEDVRAMLQAGADKVVIRTGGAPLVEQCADVVGCQAVVAAMDITSLDYTPGQTKNQHLLAVAVGHAKKLADAGAGEILLTRCENEGMMCGYDLPLVAAVAGAVDIPVIAHGGAGSYEHMHQAIQEGASAVAAGAMFQFTDQTPKGAAEYLAKRGVEVRLQ